MKKLLKQQIAASPLAESWNSVPLPLLFDWFCDWTLGILRYQLTHDEEGLGLADMRKVIQYLGDKSGQAKVLAMGLAAATAAESVEQGQPQPCPASRSPAGAVGKPARAGLESR